MRKVRKFDNKVQHTKYQVLREVAREAFNDNLDKGILDVPERIAPGRKPITRCCIYKEKHIVNERIKRIVNKEKYHTISVIKSACDECPESGYLVSDLCRGCLAHQCDYACKFDAISFDDQGRSHIDKSLCKNCGLCAAACPYKAITNLIRPCVQSCVPKAIGMDEDNACEINYDACVSCGACVVACPFGAITDKSYILDVIELLKNEDKGDKYNTYAIVAPSISSQFIYSTLGQTIQGIRQLGFHSVVEAALGADAVALLESAELVEKGQLTSSCCPAFVKYIRTSFPECESYISHNFSPMAEIAKHIKELDKKAKTVFIGPCTAKKDEAQLDEVKPYVDAVITFEELQALFDSRDFNLSELEESHLDNASYYGRIFARTGGLSESVVQALEEQEIDFEVKPAVCNGLSDCKKALNLLKYGKLKENFIEGMACQGGCIGGAGVLTHGPKNIKEVDKYGEEAREKTIFSAVSQFDGLIK